MVDDLLVDQYFRAERLNPYHTRLALIIATNAVMVLRAIKDFDHRAYWLLALFLINAFYLWLIIRYEREREKFKNLLFSHEFGD